MKKFFDYIFINNYAIAFFITLIVSIGLIIGGFFVPPIGEVSGSVITAVGELFLWPSLALGAKALSEGRVAKFQRGDTTVTIGEDNKEEDKDE